MWKTSSPLNVNSKGSQSTYLNIAIKGFLLNILNPKLSIFFLAFIPQFVPANQDGALSHMLILGSIFMALTFAVFVIYGFLSGNFSLFIVNSKRATMTMQRLFSASFAGLGLKLAFTERWWKYANLSLIAYFGVSVLATYLHSDFGRGIYAAI